MKNTVFIATSLDGYIADPQGGVDWLHQIDNPDNLDMGYQAHMANIDALVMGRNTMELVLSLGIEWPYTKPVYVLSNTLKRVPDALDGKVFLTRGEPKEIVKTLHEKGLYNLYIDGGKTISAFLQQDLIDTMIITTIPVVLGQGIRLFGELNQALWFKHINTHTYLNAIVQNEYERQRDHKEN